MRTITFSLLIFLLKVLVIDAQLTLESVYEKVNHLETEVAALKVNILVNPGKSTDPRTAWSVYRSVRVGSIFVGVYWCWSEFLKNFAFLVRCGAKI